MEEGGGSNFPQCKRDTKKSCDRCYGPKRQNTLLEDFCRQTTRVIHCQVEVKMEGFMRQGNLLVSVRQVPALSCQTIFSTQRSTPHPKCDHGRYVINGVYGDSFGLGDGEVNQGRLIVVDRSHFVFLLHRETLRESRSSRELFFVYRPLDETFSTSFRVVARRLRSISLSPELCTDSKRTSQLRLETFLRSSQVILAGRNF